MIEDNMDISSIHSLIFSSLIETESAPAQPKQHTLILESESVSALQKTDLKAVTPTSESSLLSAQQKDELSEVLKSVSAQLSFKLDEESGQSIVIFSDKKSGEVIRQIPAQELLDLNQNLAKYAPNSLQEDV